MALNLDYVARETGANLFRNVGLTIASILTVVVSLLLVGSAFLIRQGVDNAFTQWKGGTELIVFMEPDADSRQINSVRGDLRDDVDIRQPVRFVNKEAAFKEAKTIFRDQPEMLQTLTVEDVPVSFRLAPMRAEIAPVLALERRYTDKAGVLEVVSADDTIRTVQALSSFISNLVVLAALIVGITAAVLILNTIRMAMFARRREIEVMKLVGATNWFIRVPFMLEGLVQGLIGSLVAVGLLHVGNNLFSNRLDQRSVQLLSDFVVDSSDVTGISVLLVIVGVVASMVFSGIAASLYLDV